jgi:predicted enzyme related to lactoylglutathione lyase
MYELAGPKFDGVPSHWMTYVAVASADESATKAESLGAAILVASHDRRLLGVADRHVHLADGRLEGSLPPLARGA